MKRCWFIWMAVLVAVFSVRGQEVSAVLDHDQIKIGEQTTIVLEVRFPASAKSVVMPALKDTLRRPSSLYVDVEDFSPSRRSFQDFLIQD